MQSLVSFLSRPRSWLGGLLVLVLLGVGWWRWNAHAAMQPLSDDSSVRILLGLAAAARHDGHRVTPVGGNAFEFYFSVLQLEPGNSAALAALRDMFKPACTDVENSIVAGDLDEAQRELQLLRAYDAGNYRYDPAHDQLSASDYKLALLGGYLDAQRTLLERKHAEQAAVMAVGQAAAAQ